MKWSNGYRIGLRLFGIAFYSSLVFTKLYAGQTSAILGADQSYSEICVTIAGQQRCYQPRPDLGYVVKAKDNNEAIASVYRDLSFSAPDKLGPVGGRDRRGLWTKEDNQSTAQNKAAINMLSSRKQVQYVAPLFACNEETIAVIPEIVVKVAPEIKPDRLELLCSKIGCTVIKLMEFTTREYLLGVQGSNAEAVFTAVNEFNKIDWIEWAAPNIAFSPKPCGQVIPNDEYWSELWHLHNTGQFGGTPNDDINAPEAWEITTGDPNVVVAVIDTGVDLDHPDLVNNLVPGYDFRNNDDLPEPANSAQAHGTACAGLIAAEGNNSIGVVGVTWKCKVMPIRAYIWGNWGATPESQIATAVRWAAAHGADILSNSWEDNIPLPIVRSAFADVTRTGGIGRNGKGCVALAAAGNEGSFVHTPAAYPELVAVGGTDSNDVCWDYSNYGPELDVVAPTGGWPVLPPMWTTDIVGSIGYNNDNFYDKSILDYTDSMSGTSGACPVAAGVAALILSIEPDLTGDEVRHFLERSAKDLGDLGRDAYYGWGRIDARAALDMVLAKRCDLNDDLKVDEQDMTLLNEYIDVNDLLGDIAPAAKRDGREDEQDIELLLQYMGTEIPEILGPGLIAYWKLDETEDDIAYNSASDNHGVLNGNPTWQPDSGQVAGALQFDGIDDYISTDFVLNPADGSFSVFVWIKGGAPGQVILSQTDGPDGTGEIWLGADAVEGKLMTGIRPPSGRSPTPPMVSDSFITDGQWHHVGIVVTTKGVRSLYADGIRVAYDTNANNLSSSNGGLYFGTGKNLDAGTFFSGLIDDVRIYDKALSAEEIAALAQ